MTPDAALHLLADVEAFCTAIRPIEELCYVEHRFNDQVIPLARTHNLLGMIAPTHLGGRGADAVTYLRALTRIGREGTGVRTFFSGHISIGIYPILTWGTPEQHARLIPAACRGDLVLAFGLTEPEAGSNPKEMTSTYRREADGYHLNGVKYLISNGGIADAVIVFAYPEISPDPAHRRISAFIVPTRQPGFVAEDLTAKMGMPTSNTAMFELTDAIVPIENLLGEEGDGFRIAMSTLVSGRLSVAAGCLGVIEDCLIESLEYARMRCQHGKEIGKHQLVQEHLTMIEMDRITSDALVVRAAQAKDAADAAPRDRDLANAADMLAAQAKFHATNAACDAADRAVQVFGGRGWSTLYRPGRHFMDVRVCRIYEGTDEILKLKIASGLLGKDYEAFH